MKLVGIQDKCLRVVAGAYRATPIRSLEVERHVPPIDLYLDSRLAAFQNRLANSSVGQLIEKTCATIQARIKNRRGRKTTRTTTTREQRREWVEKRAERIWNHPTKSTTQEKQRVLEAWKARWHVQETKEARGRAQDHWDQIKRSPDPTSLRLHKNLQKAESASPDRSNGTPALSKQGSRPRLWIRRMQLWLWYTSHFYDLIGS